jgi:hypothetical protein
MKLARAATRRASLVGFAQALATMEHKEAQLYFQRQHNLTRPNTRQVLSQAAQMEKEQFQRILQVQREQELAEIDKERARAEENLRHNSGLRQQIAAKEEQRQRARQQFLEEGAQARYCALLVFFTFPLLCTRSSKEEMFA